MKCSLSLRTNLRVTRGAIFAGAVAVLTAAMVCGAQTGIPPADPPPLASGTPMPEFTTTTLAGKAYSSRSLLGHVAVLDFWATWCISCKMDMPGIQKIYRDYAGRGVRVVGVSLDTDNVKLVGPTVRAIGATFPILVNAKENIKSGRDFNADVLPCVYVVDKRGIVRWSYSGDYPTEDKDIRALIDRLLKQREPAPTPG
jgi:thiol-disulfide isomerase/thioredoxin